MTEDGATTLPTVPVTRPPALLRHAAETVLAQTLANFRLWIICDGAPKETVAGGVLRLTHVDELELD